MEDLQETEGKRKGGRQWEHDKEEQINKRLCKEKGDGVGKNGGKEGKELPYMTMQQELLPSDLSLRDLYSMYSSPSDVS